MQQLVLQAIEDGHELGATTDINGVDVSLADIIPQVVVAATTANIVGETDPTPDIAEDVEETRKTTEKVPHLCRMIVMTIGNTVTQTLNQAAINVTLNTKPKRNNGEVVGLITVARGNGIILPPPLLRGRADGIGG